jgi:plasmid stabilization system protein ParE
VARLPIDLAPEAEQEARDAFVWYQERNPAAAAQFENEIAHAMDRIVEFPLAAPEIESGVRRLLLRRFPYALLYAVEPGRILVLSVMHLRRKPGYWHNRAR